MNPLVLVLIAAMWAVVLVPPLLRSRAEHRPSASVHSFRRQLSHLGRTSPAARPMGRSVGYAPRPLAGGRPAPAYGHRPAAPARRPAPSAPVDLARQRRANVLLGLLAVTAFFGAGALSSGSSLVLAVFVVSVLALAGYVVLLAQVARVEEARASRAAWSRQRAA